MTSNVRWVSKGGADKGDTMEKVGRHILFGGCGCVRRQTGTSARGGADKMSVMKKVRGHILIGGCGCVQRQTKDGIGRRKRRMMTQGGSGSSSKCYRHE